MRFIEGHPSVISERVIVLGRARANSPWLGVFPKSRGGCNGRGTVGAFNAIGVNGF